MDDDERSDLEDLEENEPDWQREFRLSHSDDPSVMTAPLRERMPSLERLDLSQDSQGLDENLSAERPLTERLEFSMENPEYWLNPSVPSDVYKVVRDDDDNVSVASDSPQQIFQQLQQVQNRTENKTDSGVAPLDDSRMQPFKEVHTVERFTIAVPIQNSNEDPPNLNTSFDPRAYDADDRQNIKSLLDNLVYILQQTLDSLNDLVPAVRSDLGVDMLQEVQPKLAKAHAVLAKTLQSATIEIPKVAACVTPPPVKQNVGNQLCDLMLSGSRLSLADGERFDKVEVDSEIVVFQPATKRKPSKESYYLTRYDPEALLNDTTDPCEIEAVTTVRRVRPKRQSLAKPPPPPTQNLDTYSWLDSEPDENVVEQVMAIASTHRSEIVRQRQQQRSQQHQPHMQPSRPKRASTKSRNPSAQSFTNLDEKERKYFNEPARKLSSMLFDVFKRKC